MRRRKYRKKEKCNSLTLSPTQILSGEDRPEQQHVSGLATDSKEVNSRPTAHLFWKAGLPISTTFCPHPPLLSCPELKGITRGEDARDSGGNEVTA